MFAMHGAYGFGIYGVDIFVKTDDAEKGGTVDQGLMARMKNFDIFTHAC